MGIFKEKDIEADYFEGCYPDEEYEVILIYGAIIDYKMENKVGVLLKRKFENSKVGFIGPFPSTMPDLFKTADFIIVGDFEYYFLKKFNGIDQLKGKIVVRDKVDMNDLPSLSLTGFPIKSYGYSPVINAKPFFALQSSRGCPYSCSYYCAYGKFQGSVVRQRSPKKVIWDILYLMENYNMRGFQFRDPTFGINRKWIEEFCSEIKSHNLKLEWGIETRLDLLDEEIIKLMFDCGLRNINIGIETPNEKIANKNKRKFIDINNQENLIFYCEKIGVKISAFYIFGYEGDTIASMEHLLEYAKMLNTFVARFAVSTPYPGTDYFKKIKKKGMLMNEDYEQYTQFNPVIKHSNLTQKQITDMVSRAYKEYYFRWDFIWRFLKWQIRRFWL